MTCKHDRTMSVYMKHNDLASLRIPHLDVDHDDYLPYIGPFGGDDTNLEICMDCGTILDWEPITDEEVKEALKLPDDEEEDDDEELPQRRSEPALPVAGPTGPCPIEEARLSLLHTVMEACGPNWKQHSDALDFLRDIAEDGGTPFVRRAASKLLDSAAGYQQIA